MQQWLIIAVTQRDIHTNNHIYSTLFKTQERKPDKRSKEIEQRKESQKQTQTKQQGHVTLSTTVQSTALMLNFQQPNGLEKKFF